MFYSTQTIGSWVFKLFKAKTKLYFFNCISSNILISKRIYEGESNGILKSLYLYKYKYLMFSFDSPSYF